MRPNSEKVLAFLQEHSGKEYTKQDLVEELDVPMAAVTGSVNGLVKKGLATERIEEYAPLAAGSKPTVIRWIQITKEGLKFDPVQEERRLAREKAEATAARKAARAKEKAERARRNSVL